jgi:hypothetical protein
MRPATSPETAADPIARAVAKVREQLGDDADVACLLDRLDAAAVGKVPRKKGRGGKSARWAAAIAQRDGALRRLRANKLYATLPPGAAAFLICSNFQTYESDRWPRERAAPVAPRDEPQRTFWMILRDHHEADGPKMPGCRQLAAILQGG